MVNKGYTFSRDIPIRLGIPVLQDNFDKLKQIQQHRPNVPTNPDRSCTYLVLRAHSDELSIQLKPNLEFPRGGAAQDSSSDQHSEEHWPGGGVKIKMALGLA